MTKRTLSRVAGTGMHAKEPSHTKRGSGRYHRDGDNQLKKNRRMNSVPVGLRTK